MSGASFIGNLNNAQLIESQWIATLTSKINAVAELAEELNPCTILQEIVNEVFAYIQARVQALEQEVERLAIVQFLLSLPTTLDEALEYLQKLKELYVDPIYNMYLTAIAQLAAMAQAIIQLTAAIANAASSIQGGCIPTIPTITITVPTPFTPPAPPGP